MTGDEVPNFDLDGYALIDDAVDEPTLAMLIQSFQSTDSSSNRDRNGSTFAMRNLLRDHAVVRQLADSLAIRGLIDPILGTDAIAVRGILFDKTPGANWKVPWHQDLSIAVKTRLDVPGYGPWSVKAGVPHVQPPVEVLQQMLTVRLHLDDCGPDNGPLLVLPGSHRHGLLSPAAIKPLRETEKPVACAVKRGGAVLMRPLLLHASRAASMPAHRRVIHIEYSSARLPAGLDWSVA
jgi:ectoine hydroxylase-related dioxygenase (phytanoyl-CoA dioxygenase family)